ncbi:MAG: lipoprotein-releasing ABC transporter permease subunit [Chromatiales bacterium]|nr:lipoprotein-releasing ABC transporter permease subunit [Chromatiales bacterium]
MFKPLPLYIGLRYTRSKRRNHFISFITFASLAGIALGVAALIVVLSVMNGFQTEVRARMLGATAHVSIEGTDGRLNDWPQMRETVLKHREVMAAAPYVDGQAMLTVGSQVSGAIIRGADPALETTVSDLQDKLKSGSLDQLVAGEYRAILGVELAIKLGVGVGEQVTVITPQISVGPTGLLPRLRRFKVVGTFQVGMGQYDRTLMIVHNEDAAKLFGIGAAVSGLRLKLDDVYAAPRVSREVAMSLPVGVYVSDWTREHQNYFRAVQLEKRFMGIALSLIVAVGAFNIVSALVMVVNDKQGDIAILRTIGLTPRGVMSIFIVQGTIIGTAGAVLGIVLGVALALNLESIVATIESWFGTELLPQNVYYINDLPSELQWGDVSLVAIVAFALTLLATLYPAWRASRVQPAEALRYE